MGSFWELFFSCLYVEWSSKVLLEASGLHFVSILRGLGGILGRFWIVLGMDFRGFWVILDCSDILRYWGVLRRSWEGFGRRCQFFCLLLLALPCFALLFLSLCCFALLCLVEPILNLKSSLPAMVCLALSFFALLYLAWPCFALVCLALPCLALLHLAWPYFTHALSVPLLLRFESAFAPSRIAAIHRSRRNGRRSLR